MGDLREPSNYYLASSANHMPVLLPSTTTTTTTTTTLSLISPERWARAEKATRQIIYKVHPTDVSEETRREVIDYIYRLIRTRTGCEPESILRKESFILMPFGKIDGIDLKIMFVLSEVFPYGSVPLRTYLPDGDIDLTAFGGAISEDVLADDIFALLEREERNRDTDFIVKDVQLIRAEVKIVKCIVQNVVVDISLNQIGGLCTLCFLEQVDRLIGKDHLFKRSIILIKAWCYYESRILGAPHGLISTYALETLVLYIFNLFHSALDGPLAVLYKFLEHFSKFDWDNYCISLNGPVCLPSFPELRAETPENGRVDLLLSSEFLRHCVDMYSVPSRGVDLSSRTFQLKHLNIIDPLKENNNLGRSVSKGNFYRIRSAFTFGARKLGRILMQPEYNLNEELKKFFSNTLERHGSEQRPDVHGSFPGNCYGNSVTPQILLSETEICPGKMSIPESNSVVYIGTMDTCQNESSPSGGVNHMGASTVNAKYCEENGHQNGSDQVLPSESLREPDQLMTGNVLDHRMRMSGDAKDLATYKSGSRKISNAEAKNRDLNGKNVSSMGLKFAPHLYISKSSAHRKAESENLDSVQSQELKVNTYIGNSCVSDGVNGYGLENDDVGKDEAPSSGGLKAFNSATKTLRQITWDWSSASEETPEYSETPSDLMGDYDTHFHCLQYARWCFEYASGAPAMPISSPLPSLCQFQNPWVAVQHSSMFTANDLSHSFINGVIPSSPFYPVNPQLIPGMNFGSEGMQKPRGTGTYFPNPNRLVQVSKPPAAKERYMTSSRPPGTGRSVKFMDTNMLDQNSRKLSQSAELVEQSKVKLGPSNNQQAVSLHAKGHSNSNGFAVDSEGSLDFGSLGHVSTEAPVLERSRQAPPKVSPTSPTGNAQMPKAEDNDRVSKNSSYHLKDNGDFPPLSV